jgi:hypothetical protein
MSTVAPLFSKADLLTAATRRLFHIMCFHSIVCCWILFAQLLLRLLTPTASVFLMNLNLLWLAERSWRVQSMTMRHWHPVVQLFFCVARIVHGAGVILSVVLWARMAVMMAGVWGG